MGGSTQQSRLQNRHALYGPTTAVPKRSILLTCDCIQLRVVTGRSMLHAAQEWYAMATSSMATSNETAQLRRNAKQLPLGINYF